MTIHDELDARLSRAFDVVPSDDQLAWLDGRIRTAIAGASTLDRRRSPVRRLLRPLAFAAALMLVAGAVGAAVGLLERIAITSTPGWQTAWDRAEVLGLQQIDAGVTVTLERAYADLNQVILAFTVEGLETPTSADGTVPPLEWSAELRDPSGRSVEEWATSGLGSGLDETGLSANVQAWEGSVTPVGGTWQLVFSSIGYGGGSMNPGACTAGSTDPACVTASDAEMIDGTWAFTFDLPAPSGSVIEPETTAAVGPATLTLSQLRITPTAIASRVALEVDGSTVTSWSPANHALSIAHGGSSYVTNTTYHVSQDPAAQASAGDLNEFTSPMGTDDASGTWTIEIPTVTYQGADGADVLIQGPWTFTVEVP